ncbi:MAG: hypothetical protein HFE45_00145 [Oscillospiraceae bacterium]|jgi:hypothetical protein|nr:hypothetical protein [Oscillospiraceae bacterium]
MFDRQQIKKILARAQEIDPGCEAFGASKHRYQFRPPLAADFVRKAEGQYGFRLPEDYFRFITEVGDGGAGPGYGIDSFADFLKPRDPLLMASFCQSLALPFEVRPMQPDEVEEYAITSPENYAKSPERYFVYTLPDEDKPYSTTGFLELGTHGCQWDFGLITAGGRFGQVFDIDNEGSCAFVAASFDEYYQLWLDWLADERKLRAEVNFWRRPTQ